MTDRTGPKISSWASRSIGPDAGEDRRLEEVAVLEVGAGRPRPADDELALAPADGHVALDLLAGRLVDERPDVGRRQSRPSPEAERPGARLEPLEQRIHDGPVHDDPAGRRAALAGRPEGRPEDAVGREVEVGVGQDDDPVLAAQLQRQRA